MSPDAAPPSADVTLTGAERRRRRRGFWRDALALRGSITLRVLPTVAAFGAIAWLITWLVPVLRDRHGLNLVVEVTPHEVVGALVGLLLVLRTNAGYDRWWEGRRLWGGIVNQSRNLATGALAYGPPDPAWRARVVGWVAAFPHVTRASLRGEPAPPAVAALVGEEGAARVAGADHMPSAVARELAGLLREALDGRAAGGGAMDRAAFLQLDRERASLIDHVGGCERILKTPLPRAYAIKIRQFLVLFLATLPFALLGEIRAWWFVPLVTMGAAYPMLALDQIGAELQNPFSTKNVSHLPLDDISATIERNVLALLAAEAAR